MTQAFDVVLNGQGYMLVPPPDRAGANSASYKVTVAPFKPVFVRTGIRDFTLPLDGKDGTRWRSDSLLPELNGYGTVRGMVLAPAVRATVLAAAQPACAAIYQGAVYIGVGTQLYRITLSGGVLNTFTAIGAAQAGAITGLWVFNNRLWLALGAPATTFASTDGVTITAAPGTVVATQGFTFAQGNWVQSRTSATTIGGTVDGGTTWNYLQTEAAIKSMVSTGRSVLVAHAAGIDELTGGFAAGGTSFAGSLAPLVRTVGAGTANDFAWMADYAGHVYVWFNGTVCLLERSTITYGKLTPVVGAPRGIVPYAVVAAGRLWVGTINPGLYELWSYDGARWCRHYSGVAPTMVLLASIAGIASDADVLLFQAGTATVYALLTSAQGHTTYPAAAGSVTCGLWDAEKPDVIKTWTEIELVWNLPDRPVGLPSGAIKIETSVDGGYTWVTAGTTTLSGIAAGGTVRQALSGVDSETLVVRVTWTPSGNGTAFRLLSVWANGWELPATPPVKRWTLKLRCADKLLNRQGTVDARGGEAMRAALIGLAASGAAVPFQDLDYDANPVAGTVRVVEIEEGSRKGDGTHFWESEMVTTLEAIS